MSRSAVLLLAFVLVLPCAGPRAEEVDLAVVHRIRTEAFIRGQVMDHMFHLADANGPRLTGSPGLRAAAGWAVDALTRWGVANARLEEWGLFGRGWSLQRFSAHMVAPVTAPLAGVPRAWTAGTGGPLRAGVVHAPLFESREEEDLVGGDLLRLEAHYRTYMDRWRGKLGGRIVLLDRTRELTLPAEPAGRRLDAASLDELARAPEPVVLPPLEWPLTKLPTDRTKRRALLAALPSEVMSEYFARKDQIRDVLNGFLRDEGVAAILSTDERGDGGIIFSERGGSHRPGAPVPPPWVVLPPESYSRILRLAERELPVEIELEVAATLHDKDLDGFNVIAEIPGGRKASEVVMLGGHLDSWHAGTGATDNAAGCAVALEAVRILRTLGLSMDRTVRLALWGGEEQGLHGSRGYVRNHFGDPITMQLKPEHARLSGYFNLDNGTGRIRGVYLQGNDMMRPVFEAWLAPFRDLGADTITIRHTGGTDHLPFDDVGLPGFQFIQDPVDYFSRTHHSHMDVVDHVQPADLMQAAAVLAAVVYHAATRPEMLPRKPLPLPLPPPKSQPVLWPPR